MWNLSSMVPTFMERGNLDQGTALYLSRLGFFFQFENCAEAQILHKIL